MYPLGVESSGLVALNPNWGGLVVGFLYLPVTVISEFFILLITLPSVPTNALPWSILILPPVVPSPFWIVPKFTRSPVIALSLEPPQKSISPKFLNPDFSLLVFTQVAFALRGSLHLLKEFAIANPTFWTW